jgi:hypothetical protein
MRSKNSTIIQIKLTHFYSNLRNHRDYLFIQLNNHKVQRLQVISKN